MYLLFFFPVSFFLRREGEGRKGFGFIRMHAWIYQLYTRLEREIDKERERDSILYIIPEKLAKQYI